MEFLRAEYTEIWVRSDTVPLVRFADRVRGIASTGIDLVGIPDLEVPAELRRELGLFGEIVSWYGANRPEFREALGSFCENVRFLEALPRDSVGEHAADFFLRQVGGMGEAIPRIEVGRAESRGSVVLHPYSGSERKNWPMERFLELERALEADGVVVEWAARGDWVRFADLGELGWWLAGAGVFVGNDSGVTHLAAAVGARVLALFGTTDPAVWGPRGDVEVVRAGWMEAIGVGEVLEGVRRRLRAG